MIIPSNQSNILKEPGGQLEIALQQGGCQAILDVMALTPWEIETLQWVDGSKPKDKIGYWLWPTCECETSASLCAVTTCKPKFNDNQRLASPDLCKL
jgi:hypothetical protein